MGDIPTTQLTETIKLDRDVLIKTILYIKTIVNQCELSDNNLNILSLFTKTDDKDEVIKTAIDRGYVRSYQSGENACSKLVGLKLLQKPDRKKRVISEHIFPSLLGDIIISKLTLHNAGS